MKGFPKHLNSRADYEYIRDKFPTTMWKPAWQALLDGEKNWFCTGKLESKEDGVKNRSHKVVEATNHDNETEYYQYELQADPNCEMVRLGFTKAEVKAALNE